MENYMIILLISLLFLCTILINIITFSYNKFNINIAKYLVSFIKLKLDENDFKSDNLTIILDLTTQSILYTVAIHPLQQLSSYDKYINKSILFILTHLKDTDVTLSDTQLNILKNIIKVNIISKN